MSKTKTLAEVEKAQTFNRLKSIISNSDNELKHMKTIRKMVEKFQDKYGECKLSNSLWEKYHEVYNIITNN